MATWWAWGPPWSTPQSGTAQGSPALRPPGSKSHGDRTWVADLALPIAPRCSTQGGRRSRGFALHRAPLAGRPDFSVLAGACQFGTAWVGLRLVHHHREVPGGEIHRGRQPSGGLPPHPPVWVVHFSKTAISRRPPEVGCEIRRLYWLPVGPHPPPRAP